MRRAPIVLTTTMVGTFGVLAFKPSTPKFTSVAVDTSTTPASGSTATATSPSSASSGSSSSAGTDTGTSSASATPSTKTVTGDAIQTQYGPTQVKVTVTGGKITTVVALAFTGNDPKSVEISTQAEPILLQEVLSQQKAAVDTVSGATISSASYEASLQSALDKIGFKASDGSVASATIPQVEEHGGPGGFGH